jgi:hypothetical protein
MELQMRLYMHSRPFLFEPVYIHVSELMTFRKLTFILKIKYTLSIKFVQAQVRGNNH